MTDEAKPKGPLTRWRAHCQEFIDADSDGHEGVFRAMDRTRSCFLASHALKVLETTPRDTLHMAEVSGFADATRWLQEEIELTGRREPTAMPEEDELPW